MRVPHPPANATRFFGRILSWVGECPKCGTVYRFSERNTGGVWNPRTSTFCCKVCGKTYLLGTLAWPVKHGGGPREQVKRPTRPQDQVPHERELAQLRARAGGWWLPPELAKGRYRPDDTNITAACTCQGERRNPHCPVHQED